jgi:hypothetical protein
MKTFSKYTLTFLLGLSVVLICTVGAYYAGKEFILFIKTDYYVREEALLPIWFTGICLEAIFVCLMLLAYKIGEAILD